MKWLDEVKVLTDKYESEGVKKGDIGTIIFAWLRNDKYEVVFSDKEIGRASCRERVSTTV